MNSKDEALHEKHIRFSLRFFLAIPSYPTFPYVPSYDFQNFIPKTKRAKKTRKNKTDYFSTSLFPCDTENNYFKRFQL